MKRVLWLLLTAALLSMTIVAVSAQDGDLCNADTIASRVNDVYTTYSDQLARTGDMESALTSMDDMVGEIDAINTECDEARYLSYVEEGTTLLEELRAGGFILYVRHAATDSSQQDTDLASCETQRNLSDRGRLDAVHIGEAWTTLAVPINEVFSTEYCRTRETAELAFGEPTVASKTELETSLSTILAIPPDEGMNTIIVGHVDLIETATGIQIPEDIRLNEGDALVYLPLGGPMGDQGYELVTRITLRNWFDLARIAADMG